MGVLSYLRNTLRKGNSKTKDSRQRDSLYYNTGTSSYSTTNSRSTRQYDHDTTTTDEDADDGWDFGARQTPDRSMHSTTPSSFAASRVLLNGDAASRSSSAASWHKTKPLTQAESASSSPVKQLPPTPVDFEAEIEFYRRAANAPSTSKLEQMVSKEMSSKNGMQLLDASLSSSAPGSLLPHEGEESDHLVAVGTIAKETRLAEEKSAQRRKRAKSVAAATVPAAAASGSEGPRPLLRHMSSAYSVKDAERRLLAAERAGTGLPPLPRPIPSSSSSLSSGSSSTSTVVVPGPGPKEPPMPSSSSPPPPPLSSSPGLGASYKPRHTMLKAKRSMPQLEGVWEHFLEETAEDVRALHTKRGSTSEGRGAGEVLRPPVRRSSKQNLLEDFSQSSLSSSPSSSSTPPPPPRVSRPPLPRHSSCPSTSSNLTIASVSSSKFSPSLSSLEMQEIIDGPRSPLLPQSQSQSPPPPHTLASGSGSGSLMATGPNATPSQRTIHQRRKHRSSNLMRISNPTSLSSTSSMTGSSLFSSTGFSFDRMSASTMTTVQDDDEETDYSMKLDENEVRRTRDSSSLDLFSMRSMTPDQRVAVARRLPPEDLRIIPESYSRSRGSSSPHHHHQHHSSQSSARQMRNGSMPSPSSILSSSFSSPNSNSSAWRYTHSRNGGPGATGSGSGTGSSIATCDYSISSSPALTPVGTPTPTTASFPITPPLSRSSSRSTPQLRQRRPSNGGGGVSVSRNAIVWQGTPPLYPQELPADCTDVGDGEEDDVDTLYFGFPRTPNSSSSLSSKMDASKTMMMISSREFLPSLGGGKQNLHMHMGGGGGGNPAGPLRRHMQRPSISDSSSEEQHSDLPTSSSSYLRSSPPVQQPRRDLRDRTSMRSKSTTNLRSPPAALEDRGSMFTTTPRHPPLPPPPPPVPGHAHFDPVPPRSAPKNVQVMRPPPSRRTRSDSDAMSPYNSSSTTTSSTTSLSSSSPRSSPLRHPIDSSTSTSTSSMGRASPARIPQRSPLSRSVDLPPRDRPSFDLAPAASSIPTRMAGKPVEWGYAV